MTLLVLREFFFPPKEDEDFTGSSVGLLRDCDRADLELQDVSRSGRENATQTSSIGHDSLLSSDRKKFSTDRRTSINVRLLSDLTNGLSNGLMVSFALVAGLSILGDLKIIILGGLAVSVAGAISAGISGYLGTRIKATAYHSTLASTQHVLDRATPTQLHKLVASTFSGYDPVPHGSVLEPLITHIASSPSLALPHVMRHLHNLSPEQSLSRKRAYVSAFTRGSGYFLGGIVPLLPYFLVKILVTALRVSVALTAVTLFAFGAGKSVWVDGAVAAGVAKDMHFLVARMGEEEEECREYDGDEGVGKEKRTVGSRCWRVCWGGVLMILLGGCAAGAAVGCVRAASAVLEVGGGGG